MIHQCGHRVEPLSNCPLFCSSGALFKTPLDHNTSKNNGPLSNYTHDIAFVS